MTAGETGQMMATSAFDAEAAVIGVGLWITGPRDGAGPRSPAGAPDAAAPRRGPVRARRKASLLAQMTADVAGQATAQGGASLARVPVVMGSAFGEMTTTIEMLAERETDGDISPTRFHNSVHNNAAAQLSITHENRGFSTSIAAGRETVAMVLLESLMLLADRGGEVLAIVADEALPPPLLLPGPRPPALAAALLLTSARRPLSSATALAWIGDLRRDPDPRPDVLRSVELANPCAAILPLLAAIGFAHGRGRIELTPGQACPWSIGFAPVERNGPHPGPPSPQPSPESTRP